MEKHRKTEKFRGKSRQYARDDIYRCLDDIKKSVTLIFIISHTHNCFKYIFLIQFGKFSSTTTRTEQVQRLGQ